MNFSNSSPSTSVDISPLRYLKHIHFVQLTFTHFFGSSCCWLPRRYCEWTPRCILMYFQRFVIFPLLLYLIIFSGVQPRPRWANPPWARGYCIRQISVLCFRVLVGLQDPVEEHQMATCIKQRRSPFHLLLSFTTVSSGYERLVSTRMLMIIKQIST